MIEAVADNYREDSRGEFQQIADQMEELGERSLRLFQREYDELLELFRMCPDQIRDLVRSDSPSCEQVEMNFQKLPCGDMAPESELLRLEKRTWRLLHQGLIDLSELGDVPGDELRRIAQLPLAQPYSCWTTNKVQPSHFASWFEECLQLKIKNRRLERTIDETLYLFTKKKAYDVLKAHNQGVIPSCTTCDHPHLEGSEQQEGTASWTVNASLVLSSIIASALFLVSMVWSTVPLFTPFSTCIFMLVIPLNYLAATT